MTRIISHFTRQIFVAGLVFVALGCAPASSQDAPALTVPTGQTATGIEVREGGAVIRYGPDYFTASTAITARDMLRTIPGISALIAPIFQLINASKRGFGSEGDQVLINGKRWSGKSNSVIDELDRIQASQVAYVDIIRGTVEGLDVRSEGLIVDVVLREDAGASGSWQAHLWTDGHGTWRPDGMASYSDKIGKVKYQASVTLAPYNRANNLFRDDILSDEEGIPFEARRDKRFDINDELSFSGSVSFPVKKTGSANINILIADKGNRHPRTIERFALDLDGAASPIDTIDSLLDVDLFETEIGADIEIPVGKGKINGRFIYSRDERDRIEHNGVTPVAGDRFDLSLETEDEVAQEIIFRGSYIWPLNKVHSLDIGLEAAFNSLDKTVALEVNDGDGLKPVELGTPDSKVRERRGELFATHFWKISKKAALETALNLEFSNIGQTGSSVDQSRNFFYIKPRVELRYDFSKTDQLRASIQRTATQLDFGDFVARFDNDNDSLDAGNPDLVPEKAWVFDVTFERRFPGETGLVSVRAFYEAITDHIGRIEIGDGAEGPGNIGSARKFGTEITTSLRLGFMGLKGVAVDITYTWQDTEATDAFLGVKRMILGNARHTIDGRIRHDINSIGLSYWLEFIWESGELESRIDSIGRFTQTTGMRFYLQKKLFDGVSLWFNWRSINEILHRERMIFNGRIIDGDFSHTENRRRQWGREFIIGLRGVF